MALKTKSKPAGLGLDLTRIGGMIEAQAPKVTARQAEEVNTLTTQQQLTGKARRDALAINDTARADAETIRKEQLGVLNGVQGQLDKARTAMALSDSDNPLDRLNLWMLQQQDSGYTREGNTARLSYLSTAAASLGEIGTIQQAGYADQIARTQELLDMELDGSDDRLALLKLSEAQGQELINAELQNQQARLGILQTNNAMQQAAMANMTDDQVAAASERAAADPNQVVNVGGVDIGLAAIQARQVAIGERRYNEQVMQTNLADQVIANMTPEQLQELHTEATGSKKRIALVNGIQVPAGRIEDRMYQLNDRDLQQTANQYNLMNIQDSLVAKSQRKILATMNPGEIETIIRNGFKDDNGVTYDATMVREARDQAVNDQQLQLGNQLMVTQAQTGMSPAVAATEQIDSVLGNLPANSPAAPALNQSKQFVAHAATLLASGDPEKIRVGHQLVTAAQEAVQSTIASEAKRLSNNDKALEAAYTETLSGRPIPADLIQSEITSKVQKGEPIGRWLSGEQNAVFVGAYREELFRIQETTRNSGMQIPKDDMQAQAAEYAMTQLTNAVAAPMSTEMLLQQTTIPGNPLNGVMSGADFYAVLQQADTQGIEAYIAGAQLPKAEADLIRNGQMIPAGLDAAQNARLYMALEKKKPGLGAAYIDWWAGSGREQLTQNYINAQVAAGRNDFTKMSQFSLVQPILPGAMGNYANTLSQGQRQVYAAEIQKQHAEFLTFGNNAQTKQIFLLEQTPGLTTQEKQIAMQQIIQPILDQGKASGVENSEELSRFLEVELQSYEPTTTQAKGVLRKIMTGRDAALKVVTDFIRINGGERYSVFGSAGVLATQGAMREMDQSTQLPWYQNLLENGVQTSGPAMNRGQL